MANNGTGTQNQPLYSGAGGLSTGPDLSEISNYAALVGNTKTGASSVRTGLTGKDVWLGLLFSETDTGNLWMFWTSGWTLVGGARTSAVLAMGTNYTVGVGQVTKRGSQVFINQNFGRSTGTVTVGDTCFTLPVGFRPPQATAVTCPTTNGPGEGFVNLIVGTDGTVKPLLVSNAAATTVFFNVSYENA